MTTTIFKSENGEVWRDEERNNYGTFKAGHELCRDMAMEIERLKQENATMQTKLEEAWSKFYKVKDYIMHSPNCEEPDLHLCMLLK